MSDWDIEKDALEAARQFGFVPMRNIADLVWRCRLEANAADVLQHPNISKALRDAADELEASPAAWAATLLDALEDDRPWLAKEILRRALGLREDDE